MITVPFYRRTQASTLVDQASYLAFDPAEHACPLQIFQDTSIELAVIERANEIDQPKLERVVKQIVPHHEENAGYHDEDVNFYDQDGGLIDSNNQPSSFTLEVFKFFPQSS